MYNQRAMGDNEEDNRFSVGWVAGEGRLFFFSFRIAPWSQDPDLVYAYVFWGCCCVLKVFKLNTFRQAFTLPTP